MNPNSAEAKLRREEHRRARAARADRAANNPSHGAYGPVGTEFGMNLKGPNSGRYMMTRHIVCGCPTCEKRWLIRWCRHLFWHSKGYGWRTCHACQMAELVDIRASARRADEFKGSVLAPASKRLIAKARETSK